MHIKLELVYLKERGHLGDLNMDERIILKLVFRKQGLKLWTQFVWLRIWTNGKPIRTL
jgi:hypothetical protein